MKIENQQLKAFLLDAGLVKEKQFEEDKPIGGIVEPEISGEQNKMPNKMS